MSTFKALVANEVEGQFGTSITELSLSDLPDHPVLVKVDYSTLNYKDGLAVSGKSKICRRYPMVCGIDLAGEVVESSDAAWKTGDRVLVNGYGLSESHWGGYSGYQRLKPEWLVRIPDGFTALDSMAIGTAGYTAMLCVLAVRDHGVEPADGPVLVTGASGGVGSFAITLLSKLGYEIVAVTGSESEHAWLQSIGASKIMARDEFSRKSKPMEAETWAAVIDSVGGQTLATAISQTRYNGVVAACGLAGGFDLPATVMPFILRNVRLQGVDSVLAPMHRRELAWKSLAELISADDLSGLYEVSPLEEAPVLADQIMAGTLSKRRVIQISQLAFPMLFKKAVFKQMPIGIVSTQKHRAKNPIMKNSNMKKSAEAYWKANVSLICKLLLVWFTVPFLGGIVFVDYLNQFRLGGYPLGFWIAQQGAIYLFVVLTFYYAKKMSDLDDEFSAEEE